MDTKAGIRTAHPPSGTTTHDVHLLEGIANVICFPEDDAAVCPPVNVAGGSGCIWDCGFEEWKQVEEVTQQHFLLPGRSAQETLC